MGRQTLSVVPKAAECFWAPSVEQGLTPCVNTQLELRKKLIEFAESKTNAILPDSGMDAISAMLDAIKELLLHQNNSVGSAR